MSQYSFLEIDEPRETSSPLYARSFGQLWNETWDVFSAHWWRWIVLGVIALGPPILISLLAFSEVDILGAFTDDLTGAAGAFSIRDLTS